MDWPSHWASGRRSSRGMEVAWRGPIRRRRPNRRRSRRTKAAPTRRSPRPSPTPPQTLTPPPMSTPMSRPEPTRGRDGADADDETDVDAGDETDVDADDETGPQPEADDEAESAEAEPDPDRRAVSEDAGDSARISEESDDEPGPTADVDATEVRVTADEPTDSETVPLSSFAAQTMSSTAVRRGVHHGRAPRGSVPSIVADRVRPDHGGDLCGGHRVEPRHRGAEPVRRGSARVACRTADTVDTAGLGAPGVLQLVADHRLQPGGEQPEPRRRRRPHHRQCRRGGRRRRPTDLHRHRETAQRRRCHGRR